MMGLIQLARAFMDAKSPTPPWPPKCLSLAPVPTKFARDWPLVVYAVGLLGIGLFVERFFCRYLCPLGAAIAIPARMRMFEWLRRYRECGIECQVCARAIPRQASPPGELPGGIDAE